MVKFKVFLVFFILISIKSYSQDFGSSSKQAKKYFKKVAAIINDNYYFLNSVDLKKILNEASPFLTNAKTSSDTYEGINYVIHNLHERHSGFLPPNKKNEYLGENGKISYPTSILLNDSIAYIKIPFFASISQSTEPSWRDSLSNQIERLDRIGVTGWIIDIRGNGGGNYYSMIGGLSPLFEDGILFYNKDKDQNLTICQIKNGIYSEQENGKIKISSSTTKKIDLRNKNLPIAILIDSNTASAAERVIVAFKGYSNSKIFGMSSAGLSTGNRVFFLDDGAMLYLVSSIMVDKNGKEYFDKISPDVYIQQKEKTDNSLLKATDWILNK